MPNRWNNFLAGLALVLGSSGCSVFDRSPTSADVEFYKVTASNVTYVNAAAINVETEQPRRIRHPRDDEVWELLLEDASRIALSGNALIRQRGDFLSDGNLLLNNPDQNPSVLDPAIQESGGQYGGGGIHAAKADFDPQFNTGVNWGENLLVQNNRFLSGGLVPGAILSDSSSLFNAQLKKQFESGGLFSVAHNWNYSANNIPSRLFSSVYVGTLQAEYRHPLWGGAGREFTSIAGPLYRGSDRPRVDRGIVISRINNEMSTIEFERQMQLLLKNVEDQYWELYLAYRIYDNELAARDDANSLLEKVTRRAEAGFQDVGAADEAQARQNYLQRKLRAADALSELFETESRLRRLLGLPVNDGRIIRPIQTPVMDELSPDWDSSLVEALSRRIELQQQQNRIRSLSLQLKAAKSLTRPYVDFVAGHQINGFGDNLFSSEGSSSDDFGSAYKSLARGDQTGWNIGLQMTVPIGFRYASAQVRNLELRLAKATSALSLQEQEISHELASVFQRLDRWYSAVETNREIREAAGQRVKALEADYSAGRTNLDLLLRSRISLVEAQREHARSVVTYNRVVMEYYYRKGALLDHCNVQLAEGSWSADLNGGSQSLAASMSLSSAASPAAVTIPTASALRPRTAQEPNDGFGHSALPTTD